MWGCDASGLIHCFISLVSKMDEKRFLDAIAIHKSAVLRYKRRYLLFRPHVDHTCGVYRLDFSHRFPSLQSYEVFQELPNPPVERYTDEADLMSAYLAVWCTYQSMLYRQKLFEREEDKTSDEIAS